MSDALSPPLVAWQSFDKAFEIKSSSQGWTSQSGTLPPMYIVMCFNLGSVHYDTSIGKLDIQCTQTLH